MPRRRAVLGGTAATLALVAGAMTLARGRGASLYTFGDSILDCGHYNDHGVTPGALLTRNDDALFPEFRGNDLASSYPSLVHRARDGSTVGALASQADGIRPSPRDIAILTIGGNDLLSGLVSDSGAGIDRFGRELAGFLDALPIRPVFIGNVYDPSFGDDERNFLGVDPRVARRAHAAVNDVLAAHAQRVGALADLHAHFLRGDASWYAHTIEPSLVGASEVRRVFLAAIRAHRG